MKQNFYLIETTTSADAETNWESMHASHVKWLGAKLAVCEDASTPAHKKKTEKRSLLSLCMTSLFLFELLVCRPIFRLCERKLAQSYRTVSQSQIVRLRHRVLIQARRQFCAFFMGALAGWGEAKYKPRRWGSLRQSFSCKIFIAESLVSIFSVRSSNRRYGSQELFCLVCV